MKITSIHVKNFRLLKNFHLDLEEDLSLVIGKNNTGKTSLLNLLNKLLASTKTSFNFNDFNLDLRQQIITSLTSEAIPSKATYIPLGISARINIEYEDSDNLSQVSKLIMSLDPADKLIVLKFDYSLSHQNISDLKDLYEEEKSNYSDCVETFLKDELISHIDGLSIKSVNSNNQAEWIDLKNEKISVQEIIGFQYIDAKRDVTNRDNDSTLSSQTARLYKSRVDTTQHKEAVKKFRTILRESDSEISKAYVPLFRSITQKVSKFGGHVDGETLIQITSELQHRNLLEGNTTVQYQQDGHSLPEQNNGLGYMNLISMIFDIEMLIDQLKPISPLLPAPINLLFIEEPEAHTHPQMQYIFIKNIKELLRDSLLIDGELKLNLQTLVSTHSSHIVAESDFEDIKYLKRYSQGSVESKNLKCLRELYNDERIKEYRFLKQYLTLNRSEVFFADKLILIEGDTERILLPAMMKKIDWEDRATNNIPLLSQNVSMIEVGAHSKIYGEFIHFLGIKTLIITDIDSGYNETTTDTPPKQKHIKCIPSHESVTHTTNDSLVYFHGKTRDDINYFISLPNDNKTCSLIDSQWEQSQHGYIFTAYQTNEEGYYARSFEDSFFNLNKTLFTEAEHEYFPSTIKKWFDNFKEYEDPFQFAEKGVNSKPSLAMEILLQSKTSAEGEDFSNWQTPAYIKEGLTWLKTN